jgi:hypothetical protein
LLVGLSFASVACEREAPAAASSKASTAAASAIAPAPPAGREAAAQSEKSETARIDGRWLLRAANHDYTVELIAADQGLRGYVKGPDSKPMPIKIGVFSDDAFLFETTGGDAGWLWSGQLSSEGLRGQRENVQTGAVEGFTARRLD